MIIASTAEARRLRRAKEKGQSFERFTVARHVLAVFVVGRVYLFIPNETSPCV